MQRSSGGAQRRQLMNRAATLRAWGGLAFALGAPHLQAGVVDAGLGVGYRLDRFSWNIAGQLDGRKPNVLSELKWKDLQTLEVRAEVALWPRSGPWGLVADGHYGVVVDGKNRDSDYAGDDRTGEFMRSGSKGDGEVGSANAGLAYRKHVYDKSVDRYALVTAALGYGRHAQLLNIEGGRQVIPVREKLTGLDSRYDTQWQGPWVSVLLAMELDEQTTVDLGFRFDVLDYDADANWNLRSDLAHPVSFRHFSSGSGVTTTLGARRHLSARWSVQGALQYKDWSAQGGRDRVYGADGGVTETRFNGADWQSLGAWVQARYRY